MTIITVIHDSGQHFSTNHFTTSIHKIMNEPSEFVFKKLLFIKKKHNRYFSDGKKHSFSCVHIVWEPPISIHIISGDLPTEIKRDIEALFWID